MSDPRIRGGGGNLILKKNFHLIVYENCGELTETYDMTWKKNLGNPEMEGVINNFRSWNESHFCVGSISIQFLYLFTKQYTNKIGDPMLSSAGRRR